MSDNDYNVQCKCGHLGSMESFDTGINGLWRCPECGKEFGSMSLDRLTPKQRHMWRLSGMPVDFARSEFCRWRANGGPVTPEDAMALLRRIDAGVIKTVGKTMRKLIKSEGRKTFMESVKGETVDGLLWNNILNTTRDKCFRYCQQVNYTTLRKAWRDAPQRAPENREIISGIGEQCFPLVKWG